MRRAFAILVLVGLACATSHGNPWATELYEDHPLVGRIWDVNAERFVDPATLADRAAESFAEIRYALVEIDIPFPISTNELFFVMDRAGWTTITARLAAGAIIIRAELIRIVCDQRHVSSDSRQTNTRTILTIDNRTVLAKFAESGG